MLFIGNSLTAVNDLPAIVQALADSAGERLQVASVLGSGTSLEDLWNAGDAPRTVDRGGWTVVVLQQGPSSLAESRRHLIEWTERYDARIGAAGGRTALYSVWPARERFGDFDRVSESYRIAARAVNGLLFPAGETWRAAWRRDPDAPLYGDDQFHPSAAGSYAAALTIFAVLFERTPVGLPPRLRLASGREIVIAPGLAALLQESAGEAVARFTPP